MIALGCFHFNREPRILPKNCTSVLGLSGGLTCVRVSSVAINFDMKILEFYFLVAIIGVIIIIVIILQLNALLEILELTDSAAFQRSERAILLHYTAVWCLVTPSTMVCRGFTATHSLQNHFTAATDWTTLWFGLQVFKLIMEHSWCCQIQLVCTGFALFLCHFTNLQLIQNVWLYTRVDAGNIQGSCRMWFVNSWALGWSRDM